MIVFIGSDHAGFELKQKLVPFLKALGHEVVDEGAYEYKADDDYPDFTAPVAREVSARPDEVRGIVIGASGQGEAIVANRFSNVRAAVFYGPVSRIQTDASGRKFDLITSTRQHNNTNVLSLGARFMSEEEAKAGVKLWLEAPFSNDASHVRRVKKIDEAFFQG